MNDENESAHTPLTPHEAWRLAIDDADAEYDRIIEAANAEYDRIIEAANAVYELANAPEYLEEKESL